MTPRVSFISGKAAPGYSVAKKIIKLINNVAEIVNSDPDVNNIFRVVFLPNYCVTLAEIVIPAADVSQHISTAGTEASGTSNMKFIMNGGIIIGSMDGANIEIAEEIGQDNLYLFGLRIEDVEKQKQRMHHMPPNDYIGAPLRKVFQAIDQGMFGDQEELMSLIDTIRNQNDEYLVCHDFYSYIEAQNGIDQCYKYDQTEWRKKSILSATCSAHFSSDRTIRQYAKEIWKIESSPVPTTSEKQFQKKKI